MIDVYEKKKKGIYRKNKNFEKYKSFITSQDKKDIFYYNMEDCIEYVKKNGKERVYKKKVGEKLEKKYNYRSGKSKMIKINITEQEKLIIKIVIILN